MKKKEKRGRKATGKFDYIKQIPRYNMYDRNGGGFTEKQINRAMKTPIRLGILSDFFTVGIFCQKTNLTEYAKRNLIRLRRKGDPARQFNKGIAEADDYTFLDIAMEMGEIRDYTGLIFDIYITQMAGEEVLLQIIEAVEEARKEPWPSLNQIEAGKNKDNRSIFVDGIGRPDARRYANYKKPPIMKESVA